MSCQVANAISCNHFEDRWEKKIAEWVNEGIHHEVDAMINEEANEKI